jgi:hypothetical protein
MATNNYLGGSSTVAMKNCKECGKEVSSNAKECPHCGAPQPRQVGIAGILGTLFVGYIVYAVATHEGAQSAQPSSSFADVSPAPSAAPEPPPLEVQSWRCEKEYGYIFVTGEVKNVSSRKLENVTAVGEFRTTSGELVKSEDALLEYNPIMPGQSSPFKAGGTENPVATKCNLAFKYLLGGGEIAYTLKEKGSPKK